MECLTIAEAAARLDMSPHTLRYYERAGLLDPVARERGRRRYDASDLAWLRFIQRLRATGMGMRRIGEYAALRRQGGTTARERMRMLEAHLEILGEREREIAGHRRALEHKIEVYQQMLADAGEGAEQDATAGIHRKLDHGPGRSGRRG